MTSLFNRIKGHTGINILIAAASALFLELAIIRLHASFFQIFAYLKNVSLLSAFLGLGIGYALGTSKKIRVIAVLPILALQTIGLYALRFTNLKAILQNPLSEQLALGQSVIPPEFILIVYGFIFIVFALNAIMFIPIGQTISSYLSKMHKLRAYAWDLIGSILGIILFTLLSFLQTPPVIWLSAFFLLWLPFIWKNTLLRISGFASIALIVFAFILPINKIGTDYYSPYQILTVQPPDKNNVITIQTSNAYYQRILDLREDAIQGNTELEHSARYYNLPYQFIDTPDRVLVVGSGTGNDVAAALRNGSQYVDAVEIDPLIYEFGRELHPEQPYSSEKVSIHIDDARSFFKKTDKTYDVIVYGLLDSHTLLSGKSGGVRLDSYVYTVEGLREAREKLNNGGIINLTFATISPELGQKIYSMLEEAFDGVPPHVYRVGYDAGVTYVAGNAEPRENQVSGFADITSEFRDKPHTTHNSTDDWPFLYMPVRTYPVSYVALLGMLLLISYALVRVAVPENTKSFSPASFFLGAGFMLVETKGITELALYYGSTWYVVSVIIVAILSMAFLANLVIMRYRNVQINLVYILLSLSIGIGYASTYLHSLLGSNAILVSLVVPILLTIPLFFSGLAFSTVLSRGSSIGVILSSNILGAMLGGFLEYNSMYFGFRSLYILAFVMYACAWFFSKQTSDS